jgi:hypothetical protein
MFKFCNKIWRDGQVYTHNLINNQEERKTYPRTELLENEDVDISPDELKKLRVNTLLYIKQCKNTYYKYVCKEKFNEKLYESFIDDDHFDGGITGIDEDDDVRIFDKYILEYIKCRNDLQTYLLCKNKKINAKSSMSELVDFRSSGDEKDILFVIDMSDREIFDYCCNTKKNMKNSNIVKNMILSMILKYNNEFVNIKLNLTKTNKQHYRILLESYLQ